MFSISKNYVKLSLCIIEITASYIICYAKKGARKPPGTIDCIIIRSKRESNRMIHCRTADLQRKTPSDSLTRSSSQFSRSATHLP